MLRKRSEQGIDRWSSDGTGCEARTAGHRPRLAVAHDYLTQRGGAERVVLSMLRAFPEATLYTSLYEPGSTYSEFASRDVRASVINRFPALRSDHRLALPVLAPTFSARVVDAEVVLCSSAGWAHGVRTTGRKVVYCHSIAKWLHQPERYAVSGGAARAAIRVLGPPLLSWDQRAARSADRYLVNSTAVQGWVRDAYGIDAEVLPPPAGVDPTGPADAIAGIEPGFFLCVSRLLPYKNIDVVMRAAASLPGHRLVVVGRGPEMAALMAITAPNIVLLPEVSDAQLRWLYRSCVGLVAAAQEDFGLTPLEAGSFGKPTAALRWGGFLDTVIEGETGVFISEATPEAAAVAMSELVSTTWDEARISAHAANYSEERFIERLRIVIDEVAPR